MHEHHRLALSLARTRTVNSHKRPTLTNWRFATETPVTQPGFDDSSWTLPDHPVTTYRTTAAPVLYAADYAPAPRTTGRSFSPTAG